MTYTLNLFDGLLSRARRLHEAGQRRETMALLYRLLAFPDLPATAAEEVHARLGEILLKRRQRRQARRHLRAALRHRPDCARYHFLLALSLHTDPKGNKERAMRHYRRSLELAPGQTRCRGEAGLLAIEQGQTDEGLTLLGEAVQGAPGDAGAVGRLVAGLCRIGRRDEAIEAVKTARFHAPRCPRLRSLWNDLELTNLRRDQEMTAARRRQTEEPTLLPFLRVADSVEDETPGFRYDEAVALPGPHLMRIPARVGHRRAFDGRWNLCCD